MPTEPESGGTGQSLSSGFLSLRRPNDPDGNSLPESGAKALLLVGIPIAAIEFE